MKIGLYYYHLLALGKGTSRVRTVEEFQQNARHFRTTYELFPPECDHELIVVLMRGEPTEEVKSIWSGVPCRFERYEPVETDGFICQACQEQAVKGDCDFMVNCVSRAYFHRPGWLKRMADARIELGDGIYGSMASNLGCPLGTHPHPNPHLRGSIFAFDRQTFLTYPYKISTPDDEYRMECGEWNIANWYESIGKPAIMVTFDGTYRKADWFNQRNTFAKGDQSNLLNWDRHSDLHAGVA